MGKHSNRNLKMEKAFAMMTKYIQDNENDELLGVEFHCDEKSGVTVARVQYYEVMDEPPEDANCGCVGVLATADIKYGISRCLPGDNWNTIIGKYFALKHAKGVSIPKTVLEGLGHK